MGTERKVKGCVVRCPDTGKHGVIADTPNDQGRAYVKWLQGYEAHTRVVRYYMEFIDVRVLKEVTSFTDAGLTVLKAKVMRGS